MDHIIKMLQNEIKIPLKEKLIVSVSGGADSMFLLSILKDSGYKLEVVHFNHMLRDQSKIEADLVRTYCEQHHISFHYYLIEIGEGNFHHQAHHLRLHYLKDTAKITKAKYILTAHHLDDLLENILIKLTRGSNLLGYAGMQLNHTIKGLTFVKPLLYTSKEEILTYIKENNIPYLNDESNDLDFYMRNRYRHTIVPIMKQENPKLLNQAAQYHKQISLAFKFIRKTTIQTLNGGTTIDLNIYKSLDEVIQEDIIAYLIEKKNLNLSFDLIQKIKLLLLQDKPNLTYPLSSHYYVVKAYDQAFIKRINTPKNIKIQVSEGENKLANKDNFTFLTNSNTHTEDLEKLCYNKLAFPLWLRHRENGDKLAYKFGHKKLKDLLIDKKIPMEKRDALWILTDNDNQILWVQDLYTNQMLGDKHCIYFQLKELNHA